MLCKRERERNKYIEINEKIKEKEKKERKANIKNNKVRKMKKDGGKN